MSPSYFSLPLADSFETFLTPLWILSIGSTLGLILLLALWFVLFLVQRQAARDAIRVVQEGVLKWLGTLLLGLAAFAVGVVVWDAVADSGYPVERAINSVRRIPAVAPRHVVLKVPSGAEDLKLELEDQAFLADEITSYTISADQDLALGMAARESLEYPVRH